MSRKPRSDSKLKTLPDERQRDIIEMLKTKSLRKVRAHLAKDGLDTSSKALSEFFSWWRLQEQFQEWQTDSLEMMDLLKQEQPDISEAELARYGNRVFQLKAIKTENISDYTQLMSARHRAEMDWAKLNLRKEELRLAERKFQRETCELFIKWATDKAAKEIATGTASNAEKIEKLGELMFGEIWES